MKPRSKQCDREIVGGEIGASAAVMVWGVLGGDFCGMCVLGGYVQKFG